MVRKGHGHAARHCGHPRPPAETEVFGQQDEREDLAWRSGEGVNSLLLELSLAAAWLRAFASCWCSCRAK